MCPLSLQRETGKHRQVAERDFSEHRIAAQVINEFDDIMAEDHVRQRECFIEWESADGRTVKGLNTFPSRRRWW